MFKMGCVKCFLLFIIAQIVLRTTNASISEGDVSLCIQQTKDSLKQQEESTKTRIDQIKKQKTNDLNEHKDKKNTNLKSYIEKEKSIIATFKQSAIQDNYNVSACNDSSTVFDSIQKSFGSGVDTILIGYRTVIDRNYTQTLFVVNQLALSYQQLQKKLDDCQNVAACYEQLQDECEQMRTDEDISDLETRFLGGAEQISGNYRGQIDVIYQTQTKEVQKYSQQLKDCYKSNMNADNKTDAPNTGNTGANLVPLSGLVSLALLYKLFV